MEKGQEEAMFRKYPYYLYPAIEALPESRGEERQRLLRRIAAGVGPMESLRTLVGIDPDEFRDFYGEYEKPDLTTEDTIDEFIEKFGGKNAPSPEVPEEVPIEAPAVDYASQLLQMEEAPMPEDDTASLLDSFLKPEQAPKPKPIENPAEPVIGEQALVKIMVKNGNYQKALEIITELNLKNPKKSVYFADQMRFLQKLIRVKGSAQGPEKQ